MVNKKRDFDSTHEIPLSLEGYDDIFSDFDPRPYKQKALSEDFLKELNRASLDKRNGRIEITLILPKKKRNMKDEHTIKKRLKDHFRKHVIEKVKEISDIKKNGVRWLIIGSLLMILAAIIETYTKSFFMNLLVIVLTPAGWFAFWMGGEKLVYESKEKKPDCEFYDKMSKSKIIFTNR